MESSPQFPRHPDSNFQYGKFVAALAILALVAFLLLAGFFVLRDGSLPPFINALLAICWGVGGVALLYYSLNLLVESLPKWLRQSLLPYVFVGPALLILFYFFVIPTLRTFVTSFTDANGEGFVGLSNYVAVFTEREMQISFRNTLLWIVFGTFFCVSVGLLIAVLADRVRAERLAKSVIFMPLAISFVGAGIIWRFIFYFAPEGQPQIGLLNAIVTALGGEPQAWLSLIQPWNNFLLIMVLVWMQTGFCMMIFSAALKGVPEELHEAGRIDGASERRVFFSITLPYIQGTVVTVTTTILILTLKIFDVVMAMTGGQFGTEVIATQFYRQFFANRNFGYGAAIAIVLLIAVIPVMIYNLRQIARQKTL